MKNNTYVKTTTTTIMDTTPYIEETYQGASVRLERECPPPIPEEVDELLGKYPVSFRHHTYHQYEWPGGDWDEGIDNPILSPKDLEEQHKYFERVIDILLQNRLDDYHTTDLFRICSRAIVSIAKGTHTEIVNDLCMLLAWKNQTLRLMYLNMEKTVLETMDCTPQTYINGRVGIHPDHNGKRAIWVSNLFERSYAGGNQYGDEIYDHIISRLAYNTFHMTRHIRGVSQLLDAGVYEACAKLRDTNNVMMKIEMSIAFDKAFEKESTSLLRDGECKWRTLATPVPPEKQPLHGYTCRKQLNMFGNCTENTIVQRMKIPLYDNLRKDQIGLIKQLHTMQKMCHPFLCD
jgi:hypothetical protein